MEQLISETKLFQSCEVLFGTELNVSGEFLDYLQAGGIKSAYRKRVMETHPDRLIGLDLSLRKQSVARFHAVQEAYETLLTFLKTKKTGPTIVTPQYKRNGAATVRSNPAPPHRSAGNGGRQQSSHHRRTIEPIILPGETRRGPVHANTENLYEGPLPQRQLLFGHFLYYSGLTNWRTISRILTWQRTGRPRLGELGRRFGMCRQEDITTILHARKPFGQFGETAQLLGILTEQQVRILMFHQQRLQKKFGTILLEKNLLSQPELEELLDQFQHHNATLHGNVR